MTNALGTSRINEEADDARRSRREFLRAAGLGGAALALPALLSACASDATAPALLSADGSGAMRDHVPNGQAVELDFSSDVGVLNYAYALEQLEAAFYVMVLARPYAGMPTRERRVLSEVRDHEVVHRDFFKKALGAMAIPALTPNFSSIDFSSRTSVLGTARAFEDLGVAAYNGAAMYLSSDVYLVIAGKIVSVEARHAATIRDLIDPRTGSFAPKAFDDAFTPATVLAAASAYITNSITVVNA